jgi:hypothetical protein
MRPTRVFLRAADSLAERRPGTFAAAYPTGSFAQLERNPSVMLLRAAFAGHLSAQFGLVRKRFQLVNLLSKVDH